MPRPKIKLVVTGDDFGYCPKRNRGILECFLAGGVSNVSLLVNATATVDAAELAKRHFIPIGLHANLTEGAPVSQHSPGSRLLDDDGFLLGKMGFRKALLDGKLDINEVELELRAQVRRFCDLVGHLPYHMDGHQHVHVLPEVRKVFAQVLVDFGICYTRIPVEAGLQTCSHLPSQLHDFYTQVEQDALASVNVFRRHGIRWPDAYFGLTTMGKNMSVANIKQALNNTKRARCQCNRLIMSSTLAQSEELTRDDTGCHFSAEFMVHPGYPSLPNDGGCGQGPDDFSQSEDRQHELEVLTDPVLLEYYKLESVQLCAFRDL